jgi:hypothetical protein
LLPSVHSAEGKHAQVGGPSSVRDSLGEVVILEHVGRLQGFTIDRVVAPDERQRRLAVELLPLPPHRLMRFG